MAEAVRNSDPIAVGSFASGGGAVGSVTGFMRQTMAQPAIARALPALIALVVIGLAFVAWSMISAAPQRALYAGVSEQDKAAIAEALGASQIPYAVDAASGTITVTDDQYHEARMLLAGQGLPRSADSAADVLSTIDRKSTRLNSSHRNTSRMPSSA